MSGATGATRSSGHASTAAMRSRSPAAKVESRSTVRRGGLQITRTRQTQWVLALFRIQLFEIHAARWQGMSLV